MENRIISFENGVAVIEEVKTFSVSEADIAIREADLEKRKHDAEDAIRHANEELEKIAEAEKELINAKAIMAQAREKFAPTEPAEEPASVQEQIPMESVNINGGF